MRTLGYVSWGSDAHPFWSSKKGAPKQFSTHIEEKTYQESFGSVNKPGKSVTNTKTDQISENERLDAGISAIT